MSGNASLSIRGTLSYAIIDLTDKKIHARYKKEPFVVAERFRGHRINTFKFATRQAAENFIAGQLRSFR